MKRTIALFIMIFAFAAMNLNAQPFMGKGERPGKGMPFFLMEKLNLTDAQKEQIKDIHIANEKADVEVEAQLKLSKIEMKEALMEKEIDKAKILGINENIHKLSGDLKAAKLKMMLEINDLLDDSQKKLWKEHLLAMGHRKMAQKKNWHPKGGPGRNHENMER